MNCSNPAKHILLLGLVLLSLLCTGALDDRVLKRSNAKKWKRIAEVSRITARSGAKRYLEDSSAELVVPIEVDIILVGFAGDGGYGYELTPSRLLNLLGSHLQWYCPYSWETEEELGVCMHVNFQVVSNDEDPEVGTLLHKVEAHLKSHMNHSHAAYDETITTGQRKYFTVEASEMEPVFNEFMEHLYQVGCCIVQCVHGALGLWAVGLVW
eukprot:GHRQ01038579.1.p1 GENE.GHRQ01038579.1~~GHRQ01038579.1.p1  ORF type:complete len:211 (+),score=51.37 GHRQ01038579.1:361-993(+)